MIKKVICDKKEGGGIGRFIYEQYDIHLNHILRRSYITMVMDPLELQLVGELPYLLANWFRTYYQHYILKQNCNKDLRSASGGKAENYTGMIYELQFTHQDILECGNLYLDDHLNFHH